jgi:transcriptional regulator with XRE-family HTH domain
MSPTTKKLTNRRPNLSLDELASVPIEPISGQTLTGNVLSERLRNLPDGGDIGAGLEARISERDVAEPDLAFMRQEIGRMRTFLKQLAGLRAQATEDGQEAIAKRMGTSQSAVARLESGAVDPHVSTLVRYLAALGLQVTLQLESSRGAPVLEGHGYPHGASRDDVREDLTPRQRQVAEAIVDMASRELNDERRVAYISAVAEVARLELAEIIRKVVLAPGIDPNVKAAAIETMRSKWESGPLASKHARDQIKR